MKSYNSNIDGFLEKIFRFIWKYKYIWLAIFILLAVILVLTFEIYKLLINDYILAIYLVLIVVGVFIAILSTINGWQKYNNVDRKYVNHLKRLSYKGQWFSGTAGVTLTTLTFLLVSLNFYYQHKEFKRGYYQSYQNNFFELVRNYKETVESLEIPQDTIRFKDFKNESSKGRLIFAKLYNQFKKEYDSLSKESDTLNRIKLAYKNFDKTFQPYIGHYFRTLYFLLQDIRDENHLKDKQFEPFLIKTVRYQLSGYEMLLLFYNGLSNIENKFLLEKYHFLVPISDIENLLIEKKHKLLYLNSAFEDNVPYQKNK